MNNEIKRKKMIKNAEGQVILQTTKLKYAKAILEMLENNPKKLEEVIQSLETTEKDFFNDIMDYKKTNIILYDQAYTQIKTK